MSDDFVRLVSQANPAHRSQYQPAHNGYPPSTSTHQQHNDSQQLDPFFDDDDEAPDSAFGPIRQDAMQSKESGLPLTRNAALPAGVGASQVTLEPPRDILQDWDAEPLPPPSSNAKPFAGSAAFPGSQTPYEKGISKRPKRWKWKLPWSKHEEVLTGERIIALNNPTANVEFASNYVSTSKYNAVTFAPKFLFGA